MTQIPTISTERLTLRPPCLDDFEAFAAFLASSRAQYMNGPHDRHEAWSWFTNDAAQWQFFGYGGLFIETKDCSLAGQVAVIKWPDYPEPELGWLLYEGFDGQGFATEAAFALREHVYRASDLTTMVSYIDHANTASHRVAERLNARRDRNAPTPNGNDCRVYRHPAPETLQ